MDDLRITTTGAVDTAFAPVLDGQVESLAVAPDGLHVFAGGVGAFALVATSQGLWIGSDTDRTGRYEYHGRIAFMPLAGGTPVPESRVGTLPGDLFRLATDGTMTRRAFDGTILGAPSTMATGIDWSTIRGAFVVSGATDGRNWSGVNGMTMASGRLLYATSTGTLSAVDFSGGLPSGTTTILSGPAIDGQTWQSRGLLVLNLPT